MNITFLFGLGLTLISILVPFAIKDLPPEITWSGIGIGVLLLIFSFICWVVNFFLKSSPTSTYQKPKVLLLPGQNKLELHNKSSEDILLWGTKFADTPASIEKDPRTIPAGNFYYFLTDNLETQAHQIIGGTGEQVVPFEIYLSDSSNRRYIAKFGLLIQIKDTAITIHTQQLGVKEESWPG